MVSTKAKRPSVDEYIAEIQGIIKRRYPDAEFTIMRRRRNDVTMDVIGDFKNAYEVSKLVADRTLDILLETGLFIIVVPIDRDGR